MGRTWARAPPVSDRGAVHALAGERGGSAWLCWRLRLQEVSRLAGERKGTPGAQACAVPMQLPGGRAAICRGLFLFRNWLGSTTVLLTWQVAHCYLVGYYCPYLYIVRDRYACELNYRTC
jgi:hypothetical protein